MESILPKAILSVQQSEIAFSKFITANDVGTTGGHQYGYFIHKDAWPLIFDKPGIKGDNKDKFVTIKWQGDFETSSRFIYYGVGSRNEYRLTRFGKGFPYLQDENIGDLLILSKISNEYYEAFILQSDDEIEELFAELNISSSDTNGIIPKAYKAINEQQLVQCFENYIKSLKLDFPPTIELAENSRSCYNQTYKITANSIKTDPDNIILKWLDAEFQLFKILENARYINQITTPFASVEELILTANTLLNRRKSRAGKSLEHHLAEIFKSFNLRFTIQEKTEGKKKPDFLFPGIEAYKNPRFNKDKLIVLASKTTCKDRWRQILNEADRVKTKHLFTLQQGISKNQLEEMYRYNVCLIVPKEYLTSFPKEYRSKMLTLSSFINVIKANQS